ncbi:MAG: hypothetical protein D6681_04850 [Calditrichaeota bacterium]|nr:MAG: hypothetical protein D6681_04850 [Calditrichota bacterium]
MSKLRIVFFVGFLSLLFIPNYTFAGSGWTRAFWFLIEWVGDRILDEVVDRWKVKHNIEETRRKLNQDVNYARINLKGEERQQALEILRKTEKLLVEIEERVKNRKMSDSEIKSYFRSILEKEITPMSRRIDNLTRRVTELEDKGRKLEKSFGGLSDKVDSIFQRIDAMERRLYLMKQHYQTDVIVSLFYQGFSYKNDKWGKYYSHMPARLDSVVILHGMGISMGIWLRRIIILQIETGFLFDQKAKIKSNGTYWNLIAKGWSWSGSSFLTIPISDGFRIDLGGGYTGNTYQIEILDSKVRHYLFYPFVLIGIRVGKNHFLFYSNARMLLGREEVEAFKAQMGFTWTL